MLCGYHCCLDYITEQKAIIKEYSYEPAALVWDMH